ncbi:MAG: glutamate formimidoyltransferase [Bacteroidia bacterium]|nr:glutamate formimidoyltransferase [Bacteroidia bacterium]
MKRILECVPNFSEGRDMKIIEAICEPIRQTAGVKLLDIDPGASTHRTVVTFAGEPEAVIEAAFKAIQVAGRLIDMTRHQGAHPRMGATDVCPLIPVSGISVEEAVALAHKLAERVGRELNIPVYLYEYAATSPQRKSLSVIRSGEYEGFPKKILQPEWKPDYGKAEFNPRSGQTVIGVREFLAAVNFNLNTASVRLANSVAFDVRENGRIKTDNGKPTGKPVLDESGEPVRIPGKLKECKAVGWYIPEYGFAQVSMNLTNLSVTPLYQAFEEVCLSAQSRGLRVSGTEIVGLIPLSALTEAGRYFLQKQNRSLGVSEKELIKIAVQSMGLHDLKPFVPEEKIIEYKLREEGRELKDLTVASFSEELASESPAPGGGSVAALCGGLAAALGAMTANLSAGKRGWEEQTAFFSEIADQCQRLREKLIFLMDEDTRAFNKVMEAFALPKSTDSEKAVRKQAIEQANVYAAQIPLQVMETVYQSVPLLETMIEKGNPNSITDAGVGLLCACTAMEGAGLNVLINLGGISDEIIKAELKEKALQLMQSVRERKQAGIEKIESGLR